MPVEYYNEHMKKFKNWVEQKKVQQALTYGIGFGGGIVLLLLLLGFRDQLSLIAGMAKDQVVGAYSKATPMPTITIQQTPTDEPQPTDTSTTIYPQLPITQPQYQQPIYSTPTIMITLPPQRVPVYTTGAGLIYCDPSGADAVKSADQALSQAGQQGNSCAQQETQSQISCNNSCTGQTDITSCYNSCNSIYQSGSAICQAMVTSAQNQFTSIKNKFCQ